MHRMVRTPMKLPEDERCPACSGKGEVPWKHIFGQGWEHQKCSACNGSEHIADYYRNTLLFYHDIYDLIKQLPEELWRTSGWKLGKAILDRILLIKRLKQVVAELEKKAKLLEGYKGSELESMVAELMKSGK